MSVHVHSNVYVRRCGSRRLEVVHLGPNVGVLYVGHICLTSLVCPSIDVCTIPCHMDPRAQPVACSQVEVCVPHFRHMYLHAPLLYPYGSMGTNPSHIDRRARQSYPSRSTCTTVMPYGPTCTTPSHMVPLAPQLVIFHYPYNLYTLSSPAFTIPYHMDPHTQPVARYKYLYHIYVI